MSKVKILYVEDELALAHIVKDTLESQNYEVRLATDGATVLSHYTQFKPDLCLLDIMLPNVDGFTLGQQIHQQQPSLPILFLTAKGESKDVVKGFKSGGRDYLRKPFSLEELLVRIENLLHLTPKSATQSCLQIGAYRFYPKKLQLEYQNERQKLTYRETEVLLYFHRYQNAIIEKKKMLLAIWGDDTLSNARNLDVYVAKLRGYLEKDEQIEIITLRSIGYQFNVG
ncbi:MAG: response regulator transcription factor [Bacteroidota bacterium]